MKLPESPFIGSTTNVCPANTLQFDLQKFNIKQTLLAGFNYIHENDDELGDRSMYVGASDLNHDCIRSVVLSKADKGKIDIQQGIYYERGHIAEDMISKVFSECGIPHMRQVELIHPKYAFLKAHTDFMLFDGKMILVIEVKTGPIRKNDSFWKRQLHMQIGMTKIIYPDYEVRGMILDIDLTEGQLEVFEGYLPDKEEYLISLKKGLKIWQVMQDPGIEDGFARKTPLCGWCGHIAACPAFDDSEVTFIDCEEIASKCADFDQIKTDKKVAETAYYKLKRQIESFVQGFKDLGPPVNINGWIVNPISRKRRDVDSERLKADYPDIHAEYLKVSEFTILDVRPEQKPENEQQAA